MDVSKLVLILLVASTVRANYLPWCEVSVVGAGIGGLYSAWRMVVDSGAIEARNVCIFEANRRSGGKILTVENPVPGFEGYTVDLGAYRYHRSLHRFSRMLYEKVLKLPYSCYFNNWERAESNGSCPSSSTKLIFNARGTTIGLNGKGYNASSAYAEDSSNLPYRIPADFQWGPGKPLESSRNFYSLILGPKSVLPEVRNRWEELQNAIKYESAMQIVDEILEKVRGGSYKGVTYGDVTLERLYTDAGWSNEELELARDFRGHHAYSARRSVSMVVRRLLRNVAFGKEVIDGPRSMVAPAEIRDGVKRRSGMNKALDKMEADLRAAGVSVKYEKRATHIRQDPGGIFHMKFEDGTVVPTRKIIANMGKPELMGLGVDSEPMKSGTKKFRQQLDLTVVQGTSKMYCFWEDAWWITKLKLSEGECISAEEHTHRTRYHDGHVTCENAKQTKCRGGLLASYQWFDKYGMHSGSWVRAYDPTRYTALSNKDNLQRIVSGNTTATQQWLLDDVTQQLRRLHGSSLSAMGFNADVIKKPVGCVYADWYDSGLHRTFGVGGGDTPREPLFTEPVSGISLVNEAWGEYQGWAESSLLSAERALLHTFKLKKPTWMDEVFHKSMIERFNVGTRNGGR